MGDSHREPTHRPLAGAREPLGRATWAVCPARALHARVLPVRRRTCALSHSRTCGHRALARPALHTTSAMHRPTCDGRCHWAEPHGPTARLVPCMRARVLPVRRRACAFGGQCELNLGCHAKPLGATAMPGLLRLPCRGSPSEARRRLQLPRAPFQTAAFDRGGVQLPRAVFVVFIAF